MHNYRTKLYQQATKETELLLECNIYSDKELRRNQAEMYYQGYSYDSDNVDYIVAQSVRATRLA